MSVLKLPTPPGWRNGDAPLGWVSAGFVIALSVPFWWGLAAASRGDYLTGTVMIGVTVSPLLIVASLVIPVFGRSTVRTTVDSSGTSLRPGRWFCIFCYVGMVSFIVSGLLFVRFVPTGDLDIPISRGMRIFSPMLLASGVVVAILALVSAWRRGGIGYVKLTPAGIDVANIVATKYVEWTDIVEISDSTETKRTRKAIVLRLSDDTEEIIDGADIYVPRGTALYWMVRHYWRHPSDRGELTDSRAVDRLRSENFDVEVR
ncbi:hypothetical protein BST13_23570 [Mycobacterium aquaticum]|uniref:Uncharacterized protein n=1 Tax=Mycobacterium aquaticum TaxID=1927124 RepID=A0A1X0AQ20_9MYCO|nr:hypothetical protein BST13_23570 [Mycobacterium aquaticum]